MPHVTSYVVVAVRERFQNSVTDSIKIARDVQLLGTASRQHMHVDANDKNVIN